MALHGSNSRNWRTSLAGVSCFWTWGRLNAEPDCSIDIEDVPGGCCNCATPETHGFGSLKRCSVYGMMLSDPNRSDPEVVVIA